MRFSNDVSDFFKNMDMLPLDTINIIQSYIPKSVTIFLTKTEYLTNHYLVKDYINKRYTEQYIRTMVRHDNDFVFKQLLVENSIKWLKMTKYYYKECIYGNYLNFLESYSLDNKSLKCRQVILDFFEEQGLSKNQHKKKTNRYIRWRT